MTAPATLPAALLERAERDPEQPWLTLYRRDRVACRMTRAQLCAAAARWAGGLGARGVGPGDRVVLVLPTERAFYEAFWGTLWAGAVPVPVYPPVRLGRLAEYQASLAALVADSGARLLVTDEILGPALGEPGAEAALPGELAAGEPRPPAPAAGDDLALLQYTSGSTGRPKGVMLAHRNLLANIAAIGRGVAVRDDDLAVSWLPLYHDMGLIGMMLGSALLGVPLVALSPVEFLRRPARWLQLISAHRATFSAGPNFAYSLAARKLRDADLEGLDLSRWRLALCGAEPVQAATVEAFCRRFAGVGFRRAAFFPAYGLAEATLAVSFATPGEGPVVERFAAASLEEQGVARPAGGADRVRELVSAGRPVEGVSVEIRDPAGRPLPEGRRGAVAVAGPGVMAGYYRDPDATAAALRGGWLDTGDLGFCWRGELYLCGRSRAVVIQAGRNFFAEDLEAAAAGVPGVRPGGACAFSVESPARGTEEAIVVVETAAGGAGLADAVRSRVGAATGCRPERVIVVPPRTLPKTSSGKLQRFRAREWYLDGSLVRRGGDRRTAGVWTFLWAWLRGRLRGVTGRG